jgi:hypothetical protein
MRCSVYICDNVMSTMQPRQLRAARVHVTILRLCRSVRALARRCVRAHVAHKNYSPSF